MNFIQRRIQPLNPQIAFNNSTIKPTNRIQHQFHSKTDLTNKQTNRIQSQFHSKTIQPTNRIPIQRRIQPLNPKIGFNISCILGRIQTLNPQTGFNVNSIHRRIQPLNAQIGYVNSIQRRIDGFNH